MVLFFNSIKQKEKLYAKSFFFSSILTQFKTESFVSFTCFNLAELMLTVGLQQKLQVSKTDCRIVGNNCNEIITPHSIIMQIHFCAAEAHWEINLRAFADFFQSKSALFSGKKPCSNTSRSNCSKACA